LFFTVVISISVSSSCFSKSYSVAYGAVVALRVGGLFPLRSRQVGISAISELFLAIFTCRKGTTYFYISIKYKQNQQKKIDVISICCTTSGFGWCPYSIDMKIYFARRAFTSIEQRIGKLALLPVGHSSLNC
jgi:hypothetical protein